MDNEVIHGDTAVAELKLTALGKRAMDHDAIQTKPNSAAAITPTPSAAPAKGGQAITGVVPPQLGEALIREAWPTVVASSAGLTSLAHGLIRSIVLAPLGWLLLAPLFAKKFAPFICKRYTLTNRRLMIQHGLKPSPIESVALKEIDEVRLVPDSFNAFFLSGTLEVLSGGKVVMTLPGVPEPEGYRLAIVNACAAWVPGKAKVFNAWQPAKT